MSKLLIFISIVLVGLLFLISMMWNRFSVYIKEIDQNNKKIFTLEHKVNKIQNENETLKWMISRINIPDINDIFDDIIDEIECLDCNQIEKVIINSMFVEQSKVILGSELVHEKFHYIQSMIETVQDGQEYCIDVMCDDIDKDYEIVFLNKQYSVDK